MLRLFLTLLLLSHFSWAADPGKHFDLYIELGSRFHIITVPADATAGGTYEKKFNQGFETGLRIGTTKYGFYAGLAVEYWIANRKLTVGTSAISDVLKYTSAGPEFGFLFQENKRLFLILTGSALYPIQNGVDSTVDSVTTSYTGKKIVSYQIRCEIGFRVTPRFAILMGGGYRFANLKDLRNGHAGYLGLNDDFDLSGPFWGLGLAFTL